MANGEVKIDVTVDDSDAKKKIEGIGDEAEDAAGGLDDLGDSAENAGKSFGVAEAAIGSFIGNSLSDLAIKVVETIGNIAALADETREYREDMAKLDTAFTTAGHSTETAQKAYDDFYKLLGESDRSVEAVNHLAELTSNTEELAQWQTIAAGVTAKFGDSLPIEGLTEAANETAKVGAVTGPFADALNWASAESGVFSEALGGNDKALQAFNKAVKDGENVEDAFSAALAEMSTEQERSSAITATLNGLYSEAGNEYNELTANTQAARVATNNMEQAQAALGETIEPVTTAWTNLKAQGMEALQPVIETVVSKFTELTGWLQEHPAVLSVVTGTLGALAVALGIVTAAVVAQTVAQWAQNAAWLANPITWIVLAIVAAVGALVGAFLYLWNNCEGFRNFWTGLWDGIMAIVSPVVEWLKQAFTQAWEGIKKAWDFVKPYFSDIWEGIKAVFAIVKDYFSLVFSNAWEVIKLVWNNAVAYFTLIWESIKLVFSVVKTYFEGMFRTAWEAIKAVWNNVTAFFAAIWATIKGIFAVVKAVLSGNWKDAWEAIKKIVASWGAYFQTVWNGIKNVFSSVKTWFSSTFSAAWNAIKGIFANVGQFFVTVKNNIFNAFSGIANNFLTIGTNIVTGIWNGISNGLGWIKSKLSGWVGSVTDFCKKLLGIHSPSTYFRDEIGKMISLGMAIGIDEEGDKVLQAAGNVIGALTDYVEEAKKENDKTVQKYRQEYKDEQKAHSDEIASLNKETAEKLSEIDKKYNEDKANKQAELLELDKKYAENKATKLEELKKLDTDYADDKAKLDKKLAEDKKKKNANYTKLNSDYNDKIKELNKKYNEDKAKKTKELEKIESGYVEDKAKKNKELVKLDEKRLTDQAEAYKKGGKQVEDARKKHNENLLKIEDNINKTITGKMEELTALGDKYKDEAKKLWEDLEKSITDLQANYDNQLASRTKSIADSMDLWSEATKNRPTVETLMNNLNSQVNLLESYNEAIDALSERNINPQLLQEIKEMGVDATGEIQTLVRMSDKNLEKYVALWEEKQRLANEAALEELEPLKAETEQKIVELTDAALTKYDEMRAKFEEEGKLLAEETRQAMIDAENGMYDELISEVDKFVEAGAALMDGVAFGIMERAPLLAQAAADAVNGIVGATQKEGEIASPSKLMKREVGYNLADGVLAGWTDKIGAIKNKMAADMQGLTARIKTAVTLENARMSQGVGVRDTGFTDIAQAVGMQTAGINSLASEFRHGSNAQVTVPIVLDGRELGRAIVELGNTENARIGSTLVKA